MADENGISEKRRRRLDELDQLNEQLARLGMPARVSGLEAERYTTRELKTIVSATRAHYLQALNDLRGML